MLLSLVSLLPHRRKESSIVVVACVRAVEAEAEPGKGGARGSMLSYV